MSDIAKLIKKSGAVRFGEVTLRSGKTSNYYIDKYVLLSNPHILRPIVTEMYRSIPLMGVDAVAGVELGGAVLACALSMRMSNPNDGDANYPCLMIRKEPKGYGTNKLIEGTFKPGQRVVFVEDVVTTGLSALKGVEALRAAGLVVDRMICIVDREEGGRENIEAVGLRFEALCTAKEIVRRAKGL